MQVHLVQTFTPILHTGIEVGIGEKVANWLSEYWWIPVLLILTVIAYFVWKEYSKKSDNKQQEQEKEPSPKVVIDPFTGKPLSPVA